MKAKWNKIIWITAPILVAGSVYVFTNAAASNEDNGITGTLVSSEALSEAELAALQSAQPAPAPASSVDLESINPFTVYTPPASVATTTATPPATPVVAAAPFSLQNVSKLKLKTQTTLGEVKLDFKAEDGKRKLTGKIGDREIKIEGEQALQVLNQLLENLGLQDSMTTLLRGEDVKLDTTLAGALMGLEIDLKDGRKIETKPSKGKSPKAEGRHDNGNHYGWDKEQKEKEKKAKEKEKEQKGKGKDKGGQQDQDEQGEDE
ncbi:hypothetical protein CIG75_06815 [Tumebacillus algifaecis]|uniref:Uncharacterized protein n=1 Tax=Tumebacillus algifaecis TaxID=1214604 RepID=A0A223CZY3_9BACL|nr:hypothetical protein [Tumebacillus algifaecis]ASS74713.1 hypothetical protein CIG75_06815 [Tumebacillus algifaecis]